jgi:hypothetical protein
MLNGSFYHNLMEEFWVRIHVHTTENQDIEIKWIVLWCLSSSLVAKVLQCPNDKLNIDNFTYNSVYNAGIFKHIFVSLENIDKTINLSYLIVSNFMSRNTNMNKLNWDNKHLIYFLLRNHLVNRPIIILNWLRTCIIASRI